MKRRSRIFSRLEERKRRRWLLRAGGLAGRENSRDGQKTRRGKGREVTEEISNGLRAIMKPVETGNTFTQGRAGYKQRQRG